MKVVSALLLSSLTASTAFLVAPAATSQSRNSFCRVAATEPKEELEEGDVLLFSDSDFPELDFDAMMDETYEVDDNDDDEGEDDEQELIRKPHSRWSSLNQNTKFGMQKEKQDRVIKQVTESKQDKKRRLMFFVKNADRERKKAARVERKIPLTMRTPLMALKAGTKMSGIVISLTPFGAYVDIGTECDGLLHISQLSNTYFVEQLRHHLSPGQEIEVTIKSLNPEKKKLHLTMLEPEEEDDDDEDDDRIVLDEIETDDELWGEVVRVTDYGSYVELGAEVRGFLHFMDHPFFGTEPGAHPSTYMEVGQRVRVWVSDVDRERTRVKLTANRPSHLPGPRRELF